MSLSRSGSMSDESVPMENVEFSVSLKDESEHDDQQQKKPLHQHVRQQSGGSSIGSEDVMETTPMVSATQQQYWQQWQQYYAAYGYPQQQQYPSGSGATGAPSGGGYVLHHQSQTSQFVDPEQQQSNSGFANYPRYFYPTNQQVRYQQGATEPAPNQKTPYSPWSVTYAQAAPSNIPSQLSAAYPLQHKRSSSTPGGFRIGGRNVQDGGGEVYTGLLSEQSVPGNSNYGAVSTGRSPKPVRSRASSFERDQEPRRHQRSSSDTIFQSKNRTGTVPPPRPIRPVYKRMDTPPPSRPSSVSRHRRGSSFASSGGLSVSSMVSVVSDIRKSTFYNIATENKTGRVQLHFPFEAVHLVPRGKPGILYKMAVDDEVFENYHRLAEDPAVLWLDQNDSSDGEVDNTGPDSPTKNVLCRCHCTNCRTCEQKSENALPPNYFLLTVPDTLYRNILDEICAANRMPCGFFFCGHHEDVSRPSIWIAVVVVACLFSAMAYAAFVMQS